MDLKSVIVTSIARHMGELNGVQIVPTAEPVRGDFVLAEVLRLGSYKSVDVVPGADLALSVGARIIGAWGERGSSTSISGRVPSMWTEEADLLAVGGLIGIADDFPREAGAPTRLKIIGGLERAGQRLSLRREFVYRSNEEVIAPTVLVVGTSAEVGKTRVTSSLIRALTEAGHAVGGVKLSGTGRMRDTQNYIQAGAVATADYVDVGMDSTYGRQPQEVWEAAVRMSEAVVDGGAKVIIGECGGDVISSNSMPVIEGFAKANSLRVAVAVCSDALAALGLKTVFDKAIPNVPVLLAPMRRNATISASIAGSLTGWCSFTSLDELLMAVSERIYPSVGARK